MVIRLLLSYSCLIVTSANLCYLIPSQRAVPTLKKSDLSVYYEDLKINILIQINCSIKRDYLFGQLSKVFLPTKMESF